MTEPTPRPHAVPEEPGDPTRRHEYLATLPAYLGVRLGGVEE